jgi:uncharacterized membrane protein
VSVCVHVCVCVSVCVSVCVCACMSVCVYMYVYSSLYVLCETRTSAGLLSVCFWLAPSKFLLPLRVLLLIGGVLLLVLGLDASKN